MRSRVLCGHTHCLSQPVSTTTNHNTHNNTQQHTTTKHNNTPPPPPQPRHGSRRLSQACPFLFVSPFTMDLSWQPRTKAAQRRRGRRLRAAWRHEQQTPNGSPVGAKAVKVPQFRVYDKWWCSSSSWTWSWWALVGVRLLSAPGAVCAREPPVSHGGFWKNFLFYVAGLVALFALGNLDFSTFALVSFSPCGFGCCLWSTSCWIFRDASHPGHRDIRSTGRYENL